MYAFYIQVILPEDYFQKLVLFLHYVSPRDQTQVVRLGSQCLYPLSCLVVPDVIIVMGNDFPLVPTILLHELISPLELLCTSEVWKSVSPLA